MIRATYFDGKSAKAHEVNLEHKDGFVCIASADGSLMERIRIQSLQKEDAVSDDIILNSESGQKIRISGSNVEEWLKTSSTLHRSTFSMYHWSPLKLLGLTVCFISILTMLFLNIPAFTGRLAFLVPTSVDMKLGKITMKSVSQEFGGFCRDYDANRALKRLTERLLKGRKGFENVNTYIMNSSKVNAFATPGNHFVILKGLLKEAQSPNELAGVVGHELGHLIWRHQIRQMLGTLGVRTFALYVMKDVNSVGDLSLQVASRLSSLSFSRRQETEADYTAMELLNNAGIDSRQFGDFFLRVSKNQETSYLKSLLSTHPESDARAEMVSKLGKPGDEAMTPEEWKALKNACK